MCEARGNEYHNTADDRFESELRHTVQAETVVAADLGILRAEPNK